MYEGFVVKLLLKLNIELLSGFFCVLLLCFFEVIKVKNYIVFFFDL